jgi:hypothetical protein
MKYREEFINGYAWSFLSPVIISFFIAIYGGITEAVNNSIPSGIGSFFVVLSIFAFFSFLMSGLFCGVIGIPLYIALRKFNLANVYSITLVSIVVAGMYAVYDKQNGFFLFVYLMYGASSGFFFWLGSTKKL